MGAAIRRCAGWWLGAVSLPLFQFLLLRWYFRLFIWARFLWQVSRIDLRLVPTHPDRTGGLGFLALVGYAFAPCLLAQGAVLAGMIANRILFRGREASRVQGRARRLVPDGVRLFGPLLVFSPKLAPQARGLSEYGILAQRYVREFDRKWLRGGAPADEPFVGSADIQSLADLGNSFESAAAHEAGAVALRTLRALLKLTVVAAVPLLPSSLTVVSLQQLLDRVIKPFF